MSELIQIITDDRSATVSTSVGAVGATVIKSNRGGAQPVYFAPKSTSKILDYFGIPDTGNEAVDDVITYNSKYPIWVSAPSTGGLYGGVLVTTSGTIPFVGGKSSTTLDFSQILNSESPSQIPDGLITEFTKTIQDATNYVHQSFDIILNGTSINVSASDAEPEILTTTPNVGSGTYTRATGVLEFTFTSAPISTDIIKLTYEVNRSADAYFALFNKNPQADDLSVKILKDTDDNFIINLNKIFWETGIAKAVTGFPQIGSTVVNEKNGYGINIYMPELFKNSQHFIPVVNTDLAVSTFTNDTNYISFAGGVRGTTSTAQYTAGWTYFQSANLYPADVFFDTTADSAIPAIFNTLRNSYQKYSYYILPLPNEDATTAISTASSRMTDNKGLAFYWNWGYITNQYTGTNILSSLMGRRALRLGDMYDVFNGLAPAWYNENGTHGGQLGSGIVELTYDADDATQELLEAARVNPTIFHPAFGVVLTRERTSQSLLSNFASIGHTRLYDYYIKNIVGQVLPYQLYKLNDVPHRTRVKSSIEKIISPTLAAPYNLLRSFVVKVDEKNNNDEVLAREEFVVSIAIKFTPFSKWIKVFFFVTAQGVQVEEQV